MQRFPPHHTHAPFWIALVFGSEVLGWLDRNWRLEKEKTPAFGFENGPDPVLTAVLALTQPAGQVQGDLSIAWAEAY